MDYLMDYGGYWLYLGDKELGIDDWYPRRPGSLYTVYHSYYYPDTWKWVEFTPDYVMQDENGGTYWQFGSVSQIGDHADGGFISYVDSSIYDAVRLEDLAEIDEVEDDEKDEYQGFGVYREVDLGIDESLLGVRRYDAGWKDGKAESNNGFVCMWSHLASYFAAAVTVFSIKFFSKSIEL